MEIPILKDITVIFLLSIGVIFVCHRVRIPPVVGFLLTGVLAGPHVLGLVKAAREVETLAEVGVVLLLFTIGIEFSFRNLLQIRKPLLAGGSLQVGLTILTAFVVVKILGQPTAIAIFVGFLAALSSTAIVMKVLQDRAEVVSPHGRTTLGILIFQDLVIVLMILATPLLAGGQEDIGRALGTLAIKAVIVTVVVVVGIKWIVPQVLHRIAHTRSRELFLLGIVAMCFGVAWLTASIGLSLALGAFLAGLIISESEYSHHALGHILPFKDLFTSIFFVSIGMLLDVRFFLQQPVLILIAALCVLLVKALVAGGVVFLIGLPLRTAIIVGLSLSQIGEFSFVLSKFGISYGLIPGHIYQIFLVVAFLTMATTPFIIAAAPRLVDLILSLPLSNKLRAGLYPLQEAGFPRHEKHLVIVGFGLNGRNVARAAQMAGIPYVIVEMNPDTVRAERSKGQPICFGDATREAVLEHASIQQATVLVVAIPDAAATEKITKLARGLNPKLHIIIRTRFLQEVEQLYQLGANEVIPEEFETSVEIFARVLTRYKVPRDQIEALIAEARSDSYQMFRTMSIPPSDTSDSPESD